MLALRRKPGRSLLCPVFRWLPKSLLLLLSPGPLVIVITSPFFPQHADLAAASGPWHGEAFLLVGIIVLVPLPPAGTSPTLPLGCGGSLSLGSAPGTTSPHPGPHPVPKHALPPAGMRVGQQPRARVDSVVTAVSALVISVPWHF